MICLCYQVFSDCSLNNLFRGIERKSTSWKIQNILKIVGGKCFWKKFPTIIEKENLFCPRSSQWSCEKKVCLVYCISSSKAEKGLLCKKIYVALNVHFKIPAIFFLVIRYSIESCLSTLQKRSRSLLGANCFDLMQTLHPVCCNLDANCSNN